MVGRAFDDGERPSTASEGSGVIADEDDCGGREFSMKRDPCANSSKLNS